MKDEFLYSLCIQLTEVIEELKEEIQRLNTRLGESEVQRFYGEQHQQLKKDK